MKNTSEFIKNILWGLILFISTSSIMAMAEQPNVVTQPNSPNPSLPTADVSTANKGGPTSPTTIPTTKASSTTTDKAEANRARFCPFAKELTKVDLQWVVGKSWKGDSDSFISEISNFVGAQWSGVKYGTIICIYKGKDNIDFPVAIQPVYSVLVLEPSGKQWSGLVKNRKLCQSTNVYDCPFFVNPPENITDIYKQLKYKGASERGTLYEPQY